MNKGTVMENNAGNAILAMAGSTGLINWLGTADVIISIVVGILSAVGIVYSIIWHRVRIKSSTKKSNKE
jgi:hypothetical protein